MTPRARRALFTLIVFFAVCAVVDTVLQRQVGAQSSADESQLRDSLKSFTDVYSLVEQNYAEPLTGDKADNAIYDGAIPGMLRVLDPHSNFYDPKAYAKMREDQHGHYYGVGMVIQRSRTARYHVVSHAVRGHALVPRRHPSRRRHHCRSTASPTDGWTHDAGRQGAQGAQGHPRSGHHDPRRPGQAAHLRPRPRRDSAPLRRPQI